MRKRSLLRTTLKEMGYKEELLRQTISDIHNADEDIKYAIKKFIHTGGIKNISQPPVSVKMLMDAYEMNPIAALLFIDWYRKEPKNALQCLALGIDEVTDIESEELEEKG